VLVRDLGGFAPPPHYVAVAVSFDQVCGLVRAGFRPAL